MPLGNNLKLRLYLDLEWIFDRLSHEMSFKIYKENDHPFRKYSIKFILRMINENHTVLDLGCKYGEISNALAAKSKKVIGLDFDQKAINIANKRYKKDNLEFVVADARKYLMQTTMEFDVLILSHILEHLDNPKEFLEGIKSFFTYVYVEVPDFDKSYLNHYRKDEKVDLIYSDNDHVSEFDRFELTQIFSQCNLTVIQAEYIFGIQKVWLKV